MTPELTAIDLSEAWKNPNDIPGCFHRGPDCYQRTPIKPLLEAYGIDPYPITSLGKALPSGAYLAGGYLTSLLSGAHQSKDLDMYFSSEQALRETIELFTRPEALGQPEIYGGYRLATSTSQLQPGGPLVFVVRLFHSTKPVVELIKAFWYQDAEHVIDTFDFTVVQFALDGQELVYNPDSLKHLQERRLVHHRMQVFEDRPKREAKYVAKGYHV